MVTCNAYGKKFKVKCSRNIQKTQQRKQQSNNDINQHPVAASSTISTRSRRNTKLKFLGRRISHEWIEDGNTERRWYSGTVIGLINGKDGDLETVYEVLYDGDDEPYEIGHLREDYLSSSLKFIDL